MPAITSWIAAVGVASAIGGVFQTKSIAAEQIAAARKQAKKASIALNAKRPSTDTKAEIKLATTDKKLKRGKGSLAKRQRASLIGGFEGQSASDVGGLTG